MKRHSSCQQMLDILTNKARIAFMKDSKLIKLPRKYGNAKCFIRDE